MSLYDGPYRTAASLNEEEPMNDVDRFALKVLGADPSTLVLDWDWDLIKLSEDSVCGIKELYAKRPNGEYKYIAVFTLFYKLHSGSWHSSMRAGINTKIGEKIHKLGVYLLLTKLFEAISLFEKELGSSKEGS